MIGIERCMDAIARVTGKDPLDIRLLNLYGTSGTETPYGMSIDEDVLPKIIRNLAETSDYRNRRAEINLTNGQSKRAKRGVSPSHL